LTKTLLNKAFLATGCGMAAIALTAGPALAADAAAPDAQAQAPAPQQEDDHLTHTDDGGHEPIIVTGRLISGDHDAIVAPVVLSGEALARNASPQIGSLLAKLPGVSTSGFAPGASRPVLRGFDGPRVQVLNNGLGSLDASSVSADHGVAIDSLTVDRVDVLHGPEVLLYAADPAGGAVNAVDRRIPRVVPGNGYDFNGLASYGSAADSVNLGGAAEIALGDRFAAHFDASYNHSNDLRVGGYVLSPELRAQTLAQAGDLIDEGDATGAAQLTQQANARGRLSNSWAHGYTLGAGLAFIDDGGTLGLSVQRLASDYGIPPRPAVGDSDPVSISLRQTRYDLHGSVNLSGLFEKLDLRAAYGDYTHAELDAGVPATRFYNSAIESRLELVQAKRGGWRGESGIQFGTRNLRVVGDERLVPDSITDRFAVFTRQQYSFGQFDLEGSARYEHTSVQPKPDGSRTFNQYAGGVGLAWHPVESLTASLSFTHGERAPSAEELYIDGIHDATQSYERGNPTFVKERSNTVEAGLRYHDKRLAAAVTAYATDFKDFIAPVPTGELIEGYPVYQFIQVPAKFRGIEAEGSVIAAEWGGGNSLSFTAGADYVHAQLTGIGPAPRIPPLRVRGGSELTVGDWSLSADVVHNARQGLIAANEFPVGAFTLVNAGLTWRPMGRKGPLALILSGDNLTNVNGRLATSETRDFVPIAGRDVKLTLSVKI
jgi:iron complex outermembrane receptor protein